MSERSARASPTTMVFELSFDIPLEYICIVHVSVSMCLYSQCEGRFLRCVGLELLDEQK
jgi:hypothetical protein